MESTIEDYKRIRLIAVGEIPVSKDSPVYNLFQYRKEWCKNYTQTSEKSHDLFIDGLAHIENKIKEYLLLSPM